MGQDIPKMDSELSSAPRKAQHSWQPAHTPALSLTARPPQLASYLGDPGLHRQLGGGK